MVAIGDYNDDGTSDIPFRDDSTGNVGFWAMNHGAMSRLNEQISGLFALQNAIDIAGSAPELINDIGAIRHQAAVIGKKSNYPFDIGRLGERDNSGNLNDPDRCRASTASNKLLICAIPKPLC